MYFIYLAVQKDFLPTIPVCYFVTQAVSWCYDNYYQMILLTRDYCDTDTDIGCYLGYHIPNGHYFRSQLDM